MPNTSFILDRMVAGKVNFIFQLSALTVLGNNEVFHNSTKLLQELYIFHVHLISSAFTLVHPKVEIHKLHLTLKPRYLASLILDDAKSLKCYCRFLLHCVIFLN